MSRGKKYMIISKRFWLKDIYMLMKTHCKALCICLRRSERTAFIIDLWISHHMQSKMWSEPFLKY